MVTSTSRSELFSDTLSAFSSSASVSLVDESDTSSSIRGRSDVKAKLGIPRHCRLFPLEPYDARRPSPTKIESFLIRLALGFVEV